MIGLEGNVIAIFLAACQRVWYFTDTDRRVLIKKIKIKREKPLPANPKSRSVYSWSMNSWLLAASEPCRVGAVAISKPAKSFHFHFASQFQDQLFSE